MNIFSKNLGMSSALVMVVSAGVGLTAAGIGGYVLIDPSSELAETSNSTADTSQCQTWKSKTTTAGLGEDDEYEEKYDNRCDKPPLDEQIEEGNFFSEEYVESEHTVDFEEATPECKVGSCRSQAVCLADGDNIGESCGIGATCCTLQEDKEITYGAGSSLVADKFELSVGEATTIPDTGRSIEFIDKRKGMVRRTYFRLPDDSGSSCGGDIMQATPISNFDSKDIAKCGVGDDITTSNGQKTLAICEYDQNTETATLAIFQQTVTTNQIKQGCQNQKTNNGDSTGGGSTGGGYLPSSPGAVGGGSEYENKICEPSTDAKTVSDLSQLKDALGSASSGDMVYVEGDAEIDMTGEYNVEVPSGVTLASNRGCEGSEGARLYRQQGDGEKNEALLYGNSDSRITGLNLEGGGQWSENSPEGRKRMGVGVETKDGEVDNNRVANFVTKCVQTRGSDAHVHHNEITFCNTLGYGYGIRVFSSDALLDHNFIDHTRHAIAANSNSYEARYNIFGKHRKNHQLDMHGSGKEIVVEYNTIRHWEGQGTYSGEQVKMQLRWWQRPEDQSYIRNNWFQSDSTPIYIGHKGQYAKVPPDDGSGLDNIEIENNHFGFDKPSNCDIGAPREECADSYDYSGSGGGPESAFEETN